MLDDRLHLSERSANSIESRRARIVAAGRAKLNLSFSLIISAIQRAVRFFRVRSLGVSQCTRCSAQRAARRAARGLSCVE